VNQMLLIKWMAMGHSDGDKSYEKPIVYCFSLHQVCQEGI